jgi:hypothetical protein
MEVLEMTTSVDSEDFNTETALAAAVSLNAVFASRTHRRKYLGQEFMMPGQLGEALGLPRIITSLQSKSIRRRKQGLEHFQSLWSTISDHSKQRVLENIGWYDPEQLDWEDRRSNRRPTLSK